MPILLINNLPRHSGIGQYGSSLFLALRDVSQESVELMDWHSEVLDTLFYRSFGNALPFFVEETIRFVALAKSSLAVRRSYDVYHYLNPILSFFNHTLRPSVVTIHDLVPFEQNRGISDYVLSRMLRIAAHAEAIICVSSSSARLVREILKTSPEMIHVVPHGVDHSRFRPRDREEARIRLGLPTHSKIILHVGSDEPRKNIPGLFRVFSIVKKKLPRSVLIRAGAVSKEKKSVDFDGGIVSVRPTEEKLPYYYNAADMLLFPSLLEGFGFPTLESMASGTPVVTTSLPSIMEVVGDAALTCDPRDILGLAQASINVLTDSALHEELVRRSISRSQQFSWSKCAKETLGVYEKVSCKYAL